MHREAFRADMAVPCNAVVKIEKKTQRRSIRSVQQCSVLQPRRLRWWEAHPGFGAGALSPRCQALRTLPRFHPTRPASGICPPAPGLLPERKCAATRTPPLEAVNWDPRVVHRSTIHVFSDICCIHGCGERFGETKGLQMP